MKVLTLFVFFILKSSTNGCLFERDPIKNLVEDAENVHSHKQYINFGEDIDLKEFRQNCDSTGTECMIFFKLIEVVYYYDRTYLEYYRMDGDKRITINGSYSFMHTSSVDFKRVDDRFEFRWDGDREFSLPITSIYDLDVTQIPKEIWNNFSHTVIKGSGDQDDTNDIIVNEFYQIMFGEIANLRRDMFKFADIVNNKLIGQRRNVSYELGDFFQFATYAFYGDNSDFLRMWVWRFADTIDGAYYCGGKEQKFKIINGIFELHSLNEHTPDVDEPVTIQPPLNILYAAAHHPFMMKLKQEVIPFRPVTFY